MSEPEPEPEPELEPVAIGREAEDEAELQQCNDERDELFCKYLWDGGTHVVWEEDTNTGELRQVARELVPDITAMMQPGYTKVCPYVPSTAPRMRRLASFGQIRREDVVLDIGCGDGRVLHHLAQTVGCRGIGVEIDAELVAIARAGARAQGLAELLRFETADMCAVEQLAPHVAAASCVIIYLVTDALVMLYPPLAAGTRAPHRQHTSDHRVCAAMQTHDELTRTHAVVHVAAPQSFGCSHQRRGGTSKSDHASIPLPDSRRTMLGYGCFVEIM
jgi:SAM-dependent methyltransferase